MATKKNSDAHGNEEGQPPPANRDVVSKESRPAINKDRYVEEVSLDAAFEKELMAALGKAPQLFAIPKKKPGKKPGKKSSKGKAKGRKPPKRTSSKKRLPLYDPLKDRRDKMVYGVEMALGLLALTDEEKRVLKDILPKCRTYEFDNGSHEESDGEQKKLPKVEIMLKSKRGKRVDRQGCSRCGLFANCWRYNESSHGVVCLCEKCRAFALEFSFGKTDVLNSAVRVGKFDGNKG